MVMLNPWRRHSLRRMYFTYGIHLKMATDISNTDYLEWTRQLVCPGWRIIVSLIIVLCIRRSAEVLVVRIFIASQSLYSHPTGSHRELSSVNPSKKVFLEPYRVVHLKLRRRHIRIIRVNFNYLQICWGAASQAL